MKYNRNNHTLEYTAAERITLEMLKAQYHRPLKEVAQSFGISPTLLKQICRKKGISRWPHRQIRSIDKAIQDLKRKEKDVIGPELAELKAAIHANILKRKLVIDSCSWNLDARMRNAIFSYKAEDLNEFKSSQIYSALQHETDISVPKNQTSNPTRDAQQNMMNNLNTQDIAQISEERQRYLPSYTPAMYFQPGSSDVGSSSPYIPPNTLFPENNVPIQYFSVCNAYPTQTFPSSFPLIGTAQSMFNSNNYSVSRGVLESPFPAAHSLLEALPSYKHIWPFHLECNPPPLVNFPFQKSHLHEQGELASSSTKPLMSDQVLQSSASTLQTNPDFCTIISQGENNRSTIDSSFNPLRHLTADQILRIEREIIGTSRMSSVKFNCDTESPCLQWNAPTLTENEMACYNHKRRRVT